ncbi:recombination-associated protein RdgC [Candidatus Parabeggiatoa sp. HSG14]|uniref:recombination-associated protein RdgC n=1 Tax=Candidatus Parabeggiatoa sp. HSG14 TaxID=3055593 RepID=UPI0025A8F9BB|nr:recombination-associated protein RdgC [Thiotrichales bacterium HSG14]
MWFKNLHIFRFLHPVTTSAEDLHEQLTKAIFQPCGKMDMESMGWVPPLGRDSESLVHAANKCIIFSARKEEKILPPSVVREFVNDKVEEIETQQMRRVRKREKDEIREEVLHDLVPRAFTRSTYLFAYIDITHGWLLVDTPSRKKAEELVTFLRTTIGSLPVVPPQIQQSPARIMTQWLIKENDCPIDLDLADACVLTDQEGAVVNCKRQDLLAEEIQGHLDAGKLVTRLALEWNDRLGLILDDELVIRRLHLLDLIQAQLNDANTETPAQRFDAEFAIMTGELASLIKRLFEVFGGENEEAYAKMR